MTFNRVPIRFLLGAVMMVLASCGGSPTDEGDIGDGSDFEGFWQLTIDVTTANGVCAGEENEPVGVVNALITQEERVVTATAMWTSESGSVSLVGSRSGNQITFFGEYAEDGGTTSTTYTLQIGQDPLTLTGTENWSWIGPGGICPLGLASVTGVPIA